MRLSEGFMRLRLWDVLLRCMFWGTVLYSWQSASRAQTKEALSALLLATLYAAGRLLMQESYSADAVIPPGRKSRT